MGKGKGRDEAWRGVQVRTGKGRLYDPPDNSPMLAGLLYSVCFTMLITSILLLLLKPDIINQPINDVDSTNVGTSCFSFFLSSDVDFPK